MHKVADEIYGYTYGGSEVPASTITQEEFEELKASAGIIGEDEQYLRLAGEVLADQQRRLLSIGGAESSRVFRTWRAIRGVRKGAQFPNMQPERTCGSDGGFSIPASGRTTATGSTIKKRSPYAIRA